MAVKVIGEWTQSSPIAITTNTTLSSTHWGRTITNRGATGTVVFTLPAPSGANGAWFWYFGVVAQTVRFKTATADTLIALNDAQADQVSLQTTNQRIGASLMFYCDGTNWITGPGRGTVTIAT